MSGIKKCMVSRWGDEGCLIEADLSQIEIVVLAYLSGDTNMISDIINGVDFHCKRAAYKLGITYDMMFDYCHIGKIDRYIQERKKAKNFSFQRSYGAGAKAIAASIGITEEEARDYILMEERLYPAVKAIQDQWIEEVENSAVATAQVTEKGAIVMEGKLNSITGRQYTFYSEDAPEFLKKRGVLTSFRPTQIKNYPVQGFAGEILRVVLGALYRRLKERAFTRDNILLVNTVHDSILFDVHETALDVAAHLVKEVMESAPQLLEEKLGIKFDLPIKCDVEFGRNWMEMNTYEF